MVSELGFRLFSLAVAENVRVTELAKNRAALGGLRDEVYHYVSTLDRAEGLPTPGEEHTEDAVILALRLGEFARHRASGDDVIAQPLFPGCGILMAAEGDLLLSDTLYEVKNVDRNFRLADVRQLLCYVTLNWNARAYSIESVGLLNALRGVYYSIRIDRLAKAVSGNSASDLIAEITNYLTMEKISRR